MRRLMNMTGTMTTRTMMNCSAAFLTLGLATIVGGCADGSPVDTMRPGSTTESVFPTSEHSDSRRSAPLRKSVASCSTSVIVNGGFEMNGGENSSTFAGWTVTNRYDSSDARYSANIFANSDGIGPIRSLNTIPTPPEGTFAAFYDHTTYTTGILSQEIVVPEGGGTLSFELYLANRHTTWHKPASLAWETDPNQQFRVDLMNPTAGIEDMTPANILQNIYDHGPNDSLVFSEYRTISVEIDPALAGQTVRLRFAMALHQNYYLVGLDNVCLVPNQTGPTNVDLDVKPQGTNNRIRLNSDGKKMVAVLSDASFDATSLSPTSITLGDEEGTDTRIMLKKSGQPHYWLEDIDRDGDLDFVMYYSIPALVANSDVECGQTSIVINGMTMAGAAIRGVDAITVDCGS